jgi:hypothetical protein
MHQPPLRGRQVLVGKNVLALRRICLERGLTSRANSQVRPNSGKRRYSASWPLHDSLSAAVTAHLVAGPTLAVKRDLSGAEQV